MAKSDKEKGQNIPDYMNYVGQEVSLSFPEGMLEGVLGKPNFEEGVIELLPHLSIDSDYEHLYLEDKLPITIPLGRLFRESPSRPIYNPRKKGYLEGKMKKVNEDIDKKKWIEGFSSD